jgi:hypothetical protein
MDQPEPQRENDHRQRQQAEIRIPGIESWIRDIPPITRTWAFACVVVGIAIVSTLVHLLRGNAQLILRSPSNANSSPLSSSTSHGRQSSKTANSGGYSQTSCTLATSALILRTTCSSCEFSHCVFRRPADSCWTPLIGCGIRGYWRRTRTAIIAQTTSA